MTPAQEEKLLARLAKADAKIDEAKAERVRLLTQARDAGITWPRIARAMDKSIEGVQRILSRSRKQAA